MDTRSVAGEQSQRAGRLHRRQTNRLRHTVLLRIFGVNPTQILVHRGQPRNLLFRRLKDAGHRLTETGVLLHDLVRLLVRIIQTGDLLLRHVQQAGDLLELLQRLHVRQEDRGKVARFTVTQRDLSTRVIPLNGRVRHLVPETAVLAGQLAVHKTVRLTRTVVSLPHLRHDLVPCVGVDGVVGVGSPCGHVAGRPVLGTQEQHVVGVADRDLGGTAAGSGHDDASDDVADVQHVDGPQLLTGAGFHHLADVLNSVDQRARTGGGATERLEGGAELTNENC